MKLRQKLAAALATAMVVTSVPVVTMASSKNTITRPNMIQDEDYQFTVATTAPAVKVEFDNFDTTGEEFYLTLTNAEWYTTNNATGAQESIEDLSDSNVELTRIDENVVRVVVNSIPASNSSVFYADGTKSIKIPMLAELKGGTASVTLSSEGSESTITEGTYVFANTSSEVATVTVGDAESISKEGKIAAITLSEAYAGSMKKTTGNHFALIELNDGDYEFDMDAATRVDAGYAYSKTGDAIKLEKKDGGTYTKYSMTAKFSYGFAGAVNTPSEINVFVSEDNDHMYVEMPNNIQSKSKGKIELNNLHIKSTVKNPAEGNITVDVTGNVQDAKNLLVAVNGNYGAVITVEDEEKVEILAGETEEVNFTIKEAVDGTFTNDRKMDVKLSNGYMMDAEFSDEAKTKVDEKATLAAFKANCGKIKINDGKQETLGKYITDVEIEDEKVVGFTINPGAIQTKGEIDEIEFKFDLLASIEDKGEVKVSVTSRDFDEEITGVIAEIRSAVEITSEQVVLKTGLMNQVGGKITIVESEAGALNRSEQVTVKLPNVRGISFVDSKDKLPEVKVTAGDAQVSDVKIVDLSSTEQALQFTIKRDSKTASTIEISNFHIDTDRTVAEGSYEVEIGGKALTSHDETIELADFIKVGTANTEDLVGANGLAKGTSTFVIGESKYTLNGVEKVMDAQSYIQNPGYTMIPVRYVAEAFGVAGNNVLFSNGVVTLFAGNRTIQLTVGSDIVTVNGAAIKMSTKVAVKDGRTYAPVGEIARILGVSCQWDNTTKTATFTNK